MSIDGSASVEEVVEQLNQWHGDAVTTLELLDGYVQQVEEHRESLENPQAVSAYLAFFLDFVGRAVAECDRVAAELPVGVCAAHIESLRRLAAGSAAEQRRCLQFRDRCINKPLRQERMRPLLNDISITTRDQLTAFRDFTVAADRLEALVAAQPSPAEPKRGIDRRQLFVKLFKS